MAILERERELATIDSMVENVGHGEGGGLLVHGHAGIGKSTLIGAAVDRAHAAGLRVLSACGGELEQSFAFGVVRQLYDPLLRAQTERGRARLLSGAARLSAPVFGLPADDRVARARRSAGGRAARALLAHQRFGLPTGDAHRA